MSIMGKNIKAFQNILQIFAACLLVLITCSPVLADRVSPAGDEEAVQRYRQVNQTVLNEKDGEKLMVGSKLEITLPSNTGNEMDNETSDPLDTVSRFNIRAADLYLQFEKVGKLSFGQGETAGQVLSRTDLSGTDLIGYFGSDDQASGIFFYDGGLNPLSDTVVGDLVDNPDSSGKERFRYDTPKFLGLGVALSTFTEQNQDLKNKPAYDAALSYSGKAGEVAMAAAIGYATRPLDSEDGNEKRVNGSASVAFSGFSITLAAVQERPNDGEHEFKKFYYGKVGYTMEFWQIGQTALAIDYGKYSEDAHEEDNTKTMGIMFVQKIQDWSSEIYAGFRTQDLEHEGAAYDAINSLAVGTRINF